MRAASVWRVQITTVDVHDDAAFDAFYRVSDDANRRDRPYGTRWTKPELRAVYRAPSSAYERRFWIGHVDGAAVAVGYLKLPLRDNTDLCELDCAVAPDHQRRGYGRAMVGHLHAEASRTGRRLATCWVFGGVLDDAGSLVERSPGSHFCTAVGLQQRNTDMHRVLHLPVAEGLLEALAAGAAPHHAAYALTTWSDPCPDEHVAAYCALKEAMVTEVPLGDLELEPERWDEPLLREVEAQLVAMGRTRHVVAAVAADGSIVAHHEVLHAVHDPGRLYNWDTLVLPGHRGHRLGLAMKVSNLRRVQRLHPDGRELHTHNAAQNAPMIAVNDLLGFRPVELVGEWQADLATMTV